MAIPETKRSASSNVALLVFAILLGQLIAVILVSFIFQKGIILVVPRGLQFDYSEFYKSAHQLLAGLDPYMGGRMFMPPSSILLGFLLYWLPYPVAGCAFLVINLTVVLITLKRLSDVFGLNPRNRLLLFGTACIYFPVLFLIERGNLDGIMFALIVFCMTSNSRVVQGITMGVGLALKMYNGLLLVLFACKRKWVPIALSVVTFILLQLPFLHVEESFIQRLTFRAYIRTVNENISPSSLFSLLNTGTIRADHLFYILWGILLGVRILRDSKTPLTKSWPLYMPWMFTFPSLVYPYSAILGFALMAWIYSRSQLRKLIVSEWVVVIGFLVVGFQTVAWTYFYGASFTHLLTLHYIAPLGTLVMLVGASLIPAASLSGETANAAPAQKA